MSYYKKSNRNSRDIDIRLLEFKENVHYQLTDEIALNDANIYEGFASVVHSSDPFDFVTVDGPPRYNKKYNRPQVLELVKYNKLAEDFVIMMDDLDRKGEENTANLLIQELSKMGICCYKKIYEGSKKHALITTEKYKFLTSL